jgi:FKBP-type peptidyl-prolyl cis-trans isomerase
VNFSTKPLRSLAPRLIALAAALTPITYAQPSMPETPADVKAAPADALKTASGLSSKVLKAGTGTKKPGPTDEVTVHYSGWTTDGKLFDSSVQRGETISFPLNGVIKGWTEGLQLMVEGEKRRFWIPADLAYGETPSRPGAPAGMLVFDVELFSIKEGPKLPDVPEDVKAAPETAEKTASGLQSRVLAKGTGTDHPGDTDLVTFNMSLWSTDGQLLTTTHQEGGPPTIPLDKLNLKGLSEGLKIMVAGEKRRFWIPQSLTFGDNPPPGAPAGTIVGDLELISFKAPPAAPKAPEDVKAAPADAEKTASGLASKLISKGTGTEKPKATDTVEVHYSGWTTDGKLFDSSVQRGETASFPLNGVIAGWTEGLQLMVEGEKRRFWIPGGLAYGEKDNGDGRPFGTLVFDVELIKIDK